MNEGTVIAVLFVMDNFTFFDLNFNIAKEREHQVSVRFNKTKFLLN